MIIKQMTRRAGANPEQLVRYVLRYSVREGKHAEKKEFMTVLVRHNIRSSRVEDIVKEFKQNEGYRIVKRKDSIGLFHTTISFSPKDKQRVSISILKDISNKFILLRGRANLHLAVCHMEKDHAHAHIVTSGVSTNGTSSRMSKQAFKNLLKELELYQREKYPELIHSLNSHEKVSTLNKETFIQHLKERRKTNKLSLNAQLGPMLKSAQSIEGLKEQLAEQNQELYYRNGKPQGVIVNGQKHRFSSLGIDIEPITMLSEKELVQHKIFEEIQTIRNKKELCKKQEMEEKTNAEPEPLDLELQSLTKLRTRSKVFEGFEREFTQVPVQGGMGDTSISV
jgi:hypothetical protein